MTWPPGCRSPAEALHDGIIDAYKAQVIAEATRCLDAAAAAAAEAAIVPDRVTGKTPGQIRAEIARAVLKADPAAARQRREQAQKDARVELWREDAGTAAIVSFGLPPNEALAADQQITSRAMDLKAAGVPGSMDALRVRAYLDALLGQDTAARYQTTPSQPSNDSPGARTATGRTVNPAHRPGTEPPAAARRRNSPAGPGRTALRPRRSAPAAKINLTIPLATLLGLAEHPGEATGFGPIDAALARTLAAQAASHPATSWCITVTDPTATPSPTAAPEKAAAHVKLAGAPGHPRPATSHPAAWATDGGHRADTGPGGCGPAFWEGSAGPARRACRN